MKIIAILPVYNEGRSIHDLILGYGKLAEKVSAPIRLIVVNDCSADDSERWIEEARAKVPLLQLDYIRHPKNMGLGGALNTGLAALGDLEDDDVVVTMDGDNTHNPLLIRQMLDKMDEGADLVIASRYCEQSRITGLSFFRLMLSWAARYIYALRWNLPGVRDYTCNFRAYRGAVMREFLRKTGPAPYLLQQGFACAGELLRGTSAVASIAVEVPMILRYDNKFEQSNMRVMKTILNTLSMLARS